MVGHAEESRLPNRLVKTEARRAAALHVRVDALGEHAAEKQRVIGGVDAEEKRLLGRAWPACVMRSENGRSFACLSDLMTQASTSAPEQAYLVRVHMANYALFLSGMFAERVHAREQRRGAPT